MIRDNPTPKNLAGLVKAAKALAWFRPAMRLFGKTGKQMADALDDVPGIAAEAELTLSLPDRFNQVLGARGWIAYEDIHFETMRQATELAEATRLDEAEAVLTAHYNAETIRTWLRFFLSVQAYKPRHDLMLAAAKDHEDGRYHASVPVVLAQMDGLVLDLTDQYFFKRKDRRHLEAIDSIAGHSDGLAALAGFMGQVRTSTSSTLIELPYRHGILHGRDLGYANETVSAKTFAAFLALRSWALKVERGEQFEAPPIEWPNPETATWSDVGRMWKDTWRTLREEVERSRQLRRAGKATKRSRPPE